MSELQDAAYLVPGESLACTFERHAIALRASLYDRLDVGVHGGDDAQLDAHVHDCVRLSGPISASEINELEAQLGYLVPTSLRQFWQIRPQFC